jgi:hypothetical protein
MLATLQCLKKYGQRLDHELASELRQPLAAVRQHLLGLTEAREVVFCRLTRFHNGERLEAWQCRVSGYVPPPAPGRKAKAAAGRGVQLPVPE